MSVKRINLSVPGDKQHTMESFDQQCYERRISRSAAILGLIEQSLADGGPGSINQQDLARYDDVLPDFLS